MVHSCAYVEEPRGRVEIRVEDYREVTDEPFGAIASIGMAEHIGHAQLTAHAEHQRGLPAPGGRLLNLAMALPPGPPHDWEKRSTSLIERYVFPD